MTEALKNFEVLLEIFSELSTKELLKCRSVCHKWNEASSFTIRKKNLWDLNLNGIFKTYLDEEYKDFLQCLNSSFTSPFPCSSLSWWARFVVQEIDDDLCDETRERRLHLLHAEANRDRGSETEPLMGPLSREDVEELQIFEYLKLYGNQINIFRIYCSAFIRVETICNLFLKQMPNLQKLYFKGTQFSNVYSHNDHCIQLVKAEMEEYSVQRPQSPLILNSLKCLEYDEPESPHGHGRNCYYGSSPSKSGSGLLGNILEAAPRLQQIKSVSIPIMDIIVNNGKIKLVKEVYINFSSLFEYTPNYGPGKPSESDHFVALLSRFSHAKPEIESLFLWDPYYDGMGDKVNNPIRRIVQSSQYSLKKLILPACYLVTLFLTNNKFESRPRKRLELELPNVEHVSIGRCRYCSIRPCDCDGSCNGMTTPECTLHDFLPFPNVKYLRLDMPSSRLETLFKNSELAGTATGETIKPFTSLKVLELSLFEEFTPILQQYFSKLFCNLSKIIFRDEWNKMCSYRYRTHKIVVDEITDLVPATVKSVEVPGWGDRWTKTEIQNRILWIYSHTRPFSSVFEHNIIQ